ncbi:hypothetical protein BW716_19040 [[Flexibacter] sp. ATCC 35208]|nr:hypothetical protein BW716_19040 [[Flexibacter] sp. ATCC 35208]
MFLLIVIIVVLATVLGFINMRMSTSFDEAKKIILFRQVGHELLLSAGDSSSRVLPIRRISNKEYRLDFENVFALVPDSLVDIISRIMKRGSFPPEYLVNVIENRSNQVVYGFSVAEQDNNIIPCTGRTLPKGRYSINILIPVTSLSAIVRWRYILPFSGLCLGLVLITIGLFQRNVKKTTIKPENIETSVESISIGKYLFYPDKKLLIIGQEQMELTAKESKLLGIFTRDQNQLIDRNKLLKEGWEDEGVITGRSLDMYVSKLRKKLQKDPDISIINIHGKGYRLSNMYSCRPLIYRYNFLKKFIM